MAEIVKRLEASLKRIELSSDDCDALEEYIVNKGAKVENNLRSRLKRVNASDAEFASKSTRFETYDVKTPPLNPFGRPSKAREAEDVEGMKSISRGVLEPRDLKIIQVYASSQPLTSDLTSELAVDPVAGVLIAMQNYADKDTSDHAQKLRNSDLLFYQWRHMARRRNQPVSGLRQIWRYCIVNQVTTAVIEQCFHIEKSAQGVTFDRGSRELTAMLGTPNGRGVGYLLHDYCKALGMKDIVSVTL